MSDIATRHRSKQPSSEQDIRASLPTPADAVRIAFERHRAAGVTPRVPAPPCLFLWPVTLCAIPPRKVILMGETVPSSQRTWAPAVPRVRILGNSYEAWSCGEEPGQWGRCPPRWGQPLCISHRGRECSRESAEEKEWGGTRQNGHLGLVSAQAEPGMQECAVYVASGLRNHCRRDEGGKGRVSTNRMAQCAPGASS